MYVFKPCPLQSTFLFNYLLGTNFTVMRKKKFI
jgi:hypothetical protein